eukprot:g5340.t1
MEDEELHVDGHIKKKVITHKDGSAQQVYWVPLLEHTYVRAPVWRSGIYTDINKARKDLRQLFADNEPQSLEPTLAFEVQPPSVFFVVGGKYNAKYHFNVVVRLRIKQPERLKGFLPLRLVLCYENHLKVADQSIMRLLNVDKVIGPRMNLEDFMVTFQIALAQPSAWPQHRGQKFRIRVTAKERLKGELVSMATSSPVLVLSKAVEALKEQLSAHDAYDSRMAHFGDQTLNGSGQPRFRRDGVDAVTSEADITISPYEQRKIQMTNMLRKLDKANVHFFPERRQKKVEERVHILRDYNAEVQRKKEEAKFREEVRKERERARASQLVTNVIDEKTAEEIISNDDEKDVKPAEKVKKKKKVKGEGEIVDLEKLTTIQKHKLKRKNPLRFSLSKSAGFVRKIRNMMPEVDPAMLDSDRESESNTPEPGDRDFWRAKLTMFARPSEIEAGQFYLREKNFPAAETFLTKGLNVRELAFGTEHPMIADTLMTLGSVRCELGRLDQSESDITRALTIRRSHYDLDTHYVMGAVSALGRTLLRAREFDRAEALWLQYRGQLEAKIRQDERQDDVSDGYTQQHNFRGRDAAMMDYHGHKKAQRLKGRKNKRKKDHPLIRDTKKQAKTVRRERERYIMRWEDKRERKLDEYRGITSEDLRNTPEEKQRVALQKTLRDLEGFETFRQFATQSEAHFQVDFWVRVEKFRQMDPDANPQLFAEEVEAICEQYIKNPTFIPSLSTAQRDRVLDALIIGSDRSISLKMFDEVRAIVTDQLAFGTFARFAGHRLGRAYLRRRFIKPPFITEDKWEKKKEKKKVYHGTAFEGLANVGRSSSESELSSDDPDDDLLSTTEEEELDVTSSGGNK